MGVVTTMMVMMVAWSHRAADSGISCGRRCRVVVVGVCADQNDIRSQGYVDHKHTLQGDDVGDRDDSDASVLAA